MSPSLQVWFRDPWGMFEDPSIDGFFMDDGSRSERFSPLYANSGFYYLQSNPRVIHFMQTVLFSYDMIVQYASHQTIVIQVTGDTPMTSRDHKSSRLEDLMSLKWAEPFCDAFPLFGRRCRSISHAMPSRSGFSRTSSSWAAKWCVSQHDLSFLSSCELRGVAPCLRRSHPFALPFFRCR